MTYGGITIDLGRAEIYSLAHKQASTLLRRKFHPLSRARRAARRLSGRAEMLNFILNIFSITTNRTTMPLLAALGIFVSACLPSFANEAFTIGCTHYKQGKFPMAKAFFLKAVQDDPTCIASHYQLANTLFQLREYDRSIAEYNACLSLKPDARMRSFCVSAMSQIQNLKRSQANKVATTGTTASSVK